MLLILYLINIEKFLSQSARRFLRSAIAAAVLAVFVACSSGSGTVDGSPTPVPSLSVVTTIYPVTYFAERIGGERVEVRSLAKPGVEAHDFEPTPGDIIEITKADVLIYTDPSFEGWVENAVESVGGESLTVVRTANLGGDPHDHDGIDPHVWLDPLLAAEQVRTIQAAFVVADSAGTELYRDNANALTAELSELDRGFASALDSCELDHIVVSHEAYGHLAERYRLVQIGLADLSAEFETTPQRIADIIEQMGSIGVGHILQEPILSDDLAETVAAETGADILPLHPLESLTAAELENGDDYFSVMRRNLDSLRTALRCG